MSRRPPNQTSRRVAVCVDKSRSYGRGVLRGIAEYVEKHGRWSLYLDPRASGSYGADSLRGWDGDGVLAFIDDPALADSLRCARIPAVELFGHRLDLGLAHVGNDEEAFGRLTAEHLLERHFRHFAFANNPVYARFKKSLGRLPHEENLRRLGYAQSLLRETALSAAEIAGHCGFSPRILERGIQARTAPDARHISMPISPPSRLLSVPAL